MGATLQQILERIQGPTGPGPSPSPPPKKKGTRGRTYPVLTGQRLQGEARGTPGSPHCLPPKIKHSLMSWPVSQHLPSSLSKSGLSLPARVGMSLQPHPPSLPGPSVLPPRCGHDASRLYSHCCKVSSHTDKLVIETHNPFLTKGLDEPLCVSKGSFSSVCEPLHALDPLDLFCISQMSGFALRKMEF